MLLTSIVLTGRHVSLVPLSHDHLAGLQSAADDGQMWRLWYTAIPKPEEMSAEISRRLGLQAASSMLPFNVLDAAGEIAGMTTFMHIDATNRRVEIGHTWYGARVQRSPLNTEANWLGVAGGSATS